MLTLIIIAIVFFIAAPLLIAAIIAYGQGDEQFMTEQYYVHYYEVVGGTNLSVKVMAASEQEALAIADLSVDQATHYWAYTESQTERDRWLTYDPWDDTIPF